MKTIFLLAIMSFVLGVATAKVENPKESIENLKSYNSPPYISNPPYISDRICNIDNYLDYIFPSLDTPKLKCDLQDADLSGKNLNYADFSGADASNANFSNVKCRGVNFQEADLSNTDFSNADCRWADFRWANISDADFTGANVQWAIFNNTIANNTDFRGANVYNADVRWAKFNGVKVTPRQIEYFRETTIIEHFRESDLKVIDEQNTTY